ncbi:MAG: 2-iminoacetate synthase ThiH [Hyphomicrobiales bacterium]
MSFYDLISSYKWKDVEESIYSCDKNDVIRAINSDRISMNDFKALLSPVAESYINELAHMSMERTKKRFGYTVRLYAPLYLSNECANSCVYCGFNCKNQLERLTLNEKQIEEELLCLKALGFEHVLLVTGEHPAKAGFDYINKAIKIASRTFTQVSVEVQPLSEDHYRQLMNSGLHSVYVYQETYNQANYKLYHPSGKKSDYQWRLETPDRLGKAGIYKLGLGVLLGLENWRVDSFFTALHFRYLSKTYWKTKYSISFPRLRPHVGSYKPQYPISDKQLVQLIAAYRLLDEDLELSLSTRENEHYRDNVFPVGITAMSAGSSTEPGGYTHKNKALEQFSVSDDRDPQSIASMLKNKGYDPVWKDWDYSLQHNIL